MENSKQTSIPMGSFWNKKIVAIPLTIGVFIFIMSVFYLAGGKAQADTYTPQSPIAEQHYKDWSSERDSKECEQQKEVAQANYNDVLHGLKVDKDMNSLKAKIEKNCGWNMIPTAKALNFEDSGTLKPVQVKELHPVFDGSPEQQKYIDYAWNTYHNKNLLFLMKAENGLITPDRQHNGAYWCGKRLAHDWGFGGISDCYHHDITSDPRFFSDPYWQIDQVYKLYKSGTKFASKPHWADQAKYFDWIN